MIASAALIVAAGRGLRAGKGLPKQYRPIAGRPMLRHSLETFVRHAAVTAVCVVIDPDDRTFYDEAARDLELLEPVAGGATRQDSVRRGLERLAELAPERVLIHDGARPFADAALIDRVLAALDRAAGALPAIPVADTLKRGTDGRVHSTVDRANLWRAQTPQGFRFADILAAHRAAIGQDLTDDAAVAERGGLAVALVEGDERNIKLTTADDFGRAETLASAALGDVRVGTGFDVHRFGPGDHVWLCGIRLEHTQGLMGHSDADVALHAITDAVLGALAAGDIGQHFPPSDLRWRGADSSNFLRQAAAMVVARGGRIAHVDVTIICERPKVGPHRAAMGARLAEILGIEGPRCSIKATTTEGLGFTGRGEGIAAQASVTLRLPW